MQDSKVWLLNKCPFWFPKIIVITIPAIKFWKFLYLHISYLPTQEKCSSIHIAHHVCENRLNDQLLVLLPYLVSIWTHNIQNYTLFLKNHGKSVLVVPDEWHMAICRWWGSWDGVYLNTKIWNKWKMKQHLFTAEVRNLLHDQLWSSKIRHIHRL